MEKFIKLKSIPAHIPLMNIDTDMIIPKQFLKTIKRTGLGKSLFYEMRYDESGKLIDKFILNNDPYSKSKIIEEKSIQELYEYSKRKEEIDVDLNDQMILYGNKKLTFDIEPAKKKRLLEGLDNIGLSLKKIPNIEKFENSMNKTKPWI